MPKMTELELQAVLNAEKFDALSATRSSKLTADREGALRYYLGDVSRDMPNIDGRSKVVSSDVSDTVEGLMPQLMEIFTGSDDVVRFDPQGPQDVDAAQQETDYVNYVFMQRNPGFMVLYTMIKDALLSKTGIVKVWTEKEEDTTRQTYYDQPADAYALIKANPEYEIVEETQHDGLYDVTIVCTKAYKCHRVANIPPEEFGISRAARDIANCGYMYHETQRRESDLLDDGYDEAQIKSLPSYTMQVNTEQTARDTVLEGMVGQAGDGLNQANRLIVTTEHYIVMDWDGTGPKKYRVTTGGQTGEQEVLVRNGKPAIEQLDRWPIAVICPVPQTHRFFGRSVADLVMDIQQIKTALMRGMLDNLYMVLNPRPEMAEALCTDSTLDDLLTMRPGQPIRTKQPGAINWQSVPFVGGEVLPAMQFLDALREWRTGVSRQGQGVDPSALQNQVATIANQMADASQAKVRLIARIFAETGIRDLFSLLHAEIRENGDQQQIVRLRGSWVTVDPTAWKARSDMTINVGLGSGSRAQQFAQLQILMNAQEKALQAQMVSPKNLWGTATELVRLLGRKDPETFFTRPGTPPDPQDPSAAPFPPQADPNQQKVQHDIAAKQMQAQIDQQQMQDNLKIQLAQAQADIEVAQRKAQLDEQKMILQAQIDAERHRNDMQAQQAQHAMHMEKHGLALEHAKAKHAFDTGGTIMPADMTPHIQAGIEQPLMAIIESHKQSTEALHKALTAPKRIVRDHKTGRAVGVETVS